MGIAKNYWVGSGIGSLPHSTCENWQKIAVYHIMGGFVTFRGSTSILEMSDPFLQLIYNC